MRYYASIANSKFTMINCKWHWRKFFWAAIFCKNILYPPPPCHYWNFGAARGSPFLDVVRVYRHCPNNFFNPPSLSGYAHIHRSTTWWKWRPSTNCLDMSVSLVAHLRAILSTSNMTIFARCAPCWRADGGGVRVLLLQHCLQLRLLDLVVATFQLLFL